MLQTSKPKYSGVSASLTWTTLVPSGDQGRGVATIGHKWGNFGLCCCGWQTVGSAPDEKSFYGVANRRNECTMVLCSRSKRKFWSRPGLEAQLLVRRTLNYEFWPASTPRFLCCGCFVYLRENEADKPHLP